MSCSPCSTLSCPFLLFAGVSNFSVFPLLYRYVFPCEASCCIGVMKLQEALNFLCMRHKRCRGEGWEGCLLVVVEHGMAKREKERNGLHWPREGGALMRHVCENVKCGQQRRLNTHTRERTHRL